jgi:hypothetical protein
MPDKGPIFGIDLKFWWGILVVIALVFGLFLLKTCRDVPRPEHPIASPGQPGTPTPIPTMTPSP